MKLHEVYQHGSPARPSLTFCAIVHIRTDLLSRHYISGNGATTGPPFWRVGEYPTRGRVDYLTDFRLEFIYN